MTIIRVMDASKSMECHRPPRRYGLMNKKVTEYRIGLIKYIAIFFFNYRTTYNIYGNAFIVLLTVHIVNLVIL